MARGTIQIKGADELLIKLKKNADLNDVKNVVRLNGSELQRKAQRRAPYDTGNLKRSIGYTSEDSGFTAKIAATAHYAGYINFGTRFIYARPFMTNSYYEQRKKFIDDLKRLMK